MHLAKSLLLAIFLVPIISRAAAFSDEAPASAPVKASPAPRSELKLVSLQMDVSAVTRENRVLAALKLLEKAADREGHGIYVLPEYALAPMPKDSAAIIAQAEAIPAPITERFRQVAEKRNIWIAVGMLEASADAKHPYNSIAI